VGGSVTVIESYVRDNSTGNVRRTQRGGNDFDGYVPNFQMVSQYFNPDEIWLLAWGMVEGASGRGLSAPGDYSQRSACMTSTRAARAAGSIAATTAEPISTSAETIVGTAPGIFKSPK
jgi:hypothetical protein